MISDVIQRRGFGLCHLLGKNCLRVGGIAKCAGASEDVGKCVARGFHFETLALVWCDRNVQIVRVGSDAFDRSLLAPELTADDAHVGAVVIRYFWNRARWNVLVSRVGHLERCRQVGPKLESVHSTLCVALGISWCRMPLPAVIHCTSPAPIAPLLPRLSPCSTDPARTYVMVSMPRCGCQGKPAR